MNGNGSIDLLETAQIVASVYESHHPVRLLDITGHRDCLCVVFEVEGI